MTIVRIEYLIDFQTLFTYLHAGLTNSRKVLVTFVCTIAVWLHLRCGLSRANADRLMKAIHILISLAINFGRLLVKFQYPNVALRPLPTPPIPHDVRTAIATLSLDPKIIRSICCPKCYSKYSLNHLPSVWKSGLRTEKRPQLDRTGPEKDRTAVLVFDIYKSKTAKRPVFVNRSRPVQTGPL